MKKSQIKTLIRFILKEVKSFKSAKLVDSWRDVSTVKRGRMAGTRGYFIMKNGKLADASYEMEGSTGIGGGVDHYGYGLALDNRKLFGISDELAIRATTPTDDDFADQDIYFKVWKKIEDAILARVMTMTKSSITGRPDTTIQFFKTISPKSALNIAQGWLGKQIPDVPENMTITIEIGHGDIYMKADTVREFMSAKDPRALDVSRHY